MGASLQESLDLELRRRGVLVGGGGWRAQGSLCSSRMQQTEGQELRPLGAGNGRYPQAYAKAGWLKPFVRLLIRSFHLSYG